MAEDCQAIIRGRLLRTGTFALRWGDACSGLQTPGSGLQNISRISFHEIIRGPVLRTAMSELRCSNTEIGHPLIILSCVSCHASRFNDLTI